MLRPLAIACFLLAASAGRAGAQESAATPGDLVEPIGVAGAYDCSGDGPAMRRFSIVGFDEGLYRIEERNDGAAPEGVARYPWQFATATLYRERVTARGATKFRRLNGSLRTLQELQPGMVIEAEYAEAPLDGSSEALEWRYRVEVGQRAASFGPSGVGEVAIVQIVERRDRYVDARRQPLPLASAASGFEIREEARISYAPELGLALRVERRRDGDLIEACALSAYNRP